MNINRDNYEAYFLDYLEGNLSNGDIEILHRFLKFNPDLEKELKHFSIDEIITEPFEYPDKEKLLKKIPDSRTEITEKNFELFCIAYLEGDLTVGQREEFDLFLRDHQEFNSLFDSFRQTFLEKEIIRYPEKAKLLKRKTAQMVIRYLLPVAAAAAILLMLFINTPENESPVEIAVSMEPEKKDVTTEKIPESPAIQSTSVFQVIKNNKAPVPQSNYKKEDQKKEQPASGENAEKTDGKETDRRLASLNLSKSSLPPINVRYDQLIAEPVAPPEVNMSSLSLEQIARYQFKRINNIIDNDDDLILSLASNGLKELNKLAGTNAAIMASKDDDGSISGIRFKSRFFDLTAPISREEE